MARRRGQRTGRLFPKGPSWLGQWWEDFRDTDGSLVRKRCTQKIAPRTGPDAISKRQAQRLFWETILSKLDSVSIKPQSLATVRDFVESKFVPQWVWSLKPATQQFYAYTLDKHVIPELGSLRLRDVTSDDVQALIKRTLEAGFSPRTVEAIRNTVSAIFNHAKVKGFYVGDNPIFGVRMPTVTPVKERRALNVQTAKQALELLVWPCREIVWLMILTSVNVAEALGLRWKRLNLTPDWVIVDGEAIQPFTVAVREHYYRGDWGTLKSGSRRRDLPLPKMLVSMLAGVKERSAWNGPEDPVFAGKTGKPIDETNYAHRHLRPLGRRLGLKSLSWHDFRRTHATLADQQQVPLGDRMAGMGHSDARMTMWYSVADVERRRQAAETMAETLSSGDGEIVQ